MDMIYVFPTGVGVVVTALIFVLLRRKRYGVVASAAVAGLAGAVTSYVTLFTIVVLMLPMG
jgi:hypothetical protein